MGNRYSGLSKTAKRKLKRKRKRKKKRREERYSFVLNVVQFDEKGGAEELRESANKINRGYAEYLATKAMENYKDREDVSIYIYCQATGLYHNKDGTRSRQGKDWNAEG